ncbi:exonuclease [Rhodococcus phage PhailMary]|uniref:Cas4 exonuclease n=1 Tax=Rhodococcus phage PhailMary TaxID=2793705 RepID=A0A7T0M325_9CAUD|nr:exonuclease [Rhodococcus phage PhailMary]QPL15209.1 Cas4 exonuclease [Rhodococcus phage PhailMary]
MSYEVKHRSVSQVKTYLQCPYSWYLQRVERAWQRPAAWLPMGTAFHTAAEKFELSGRTMSLEEMHDVYREEYAKDVGELCEKTPNFEFWFASGRYRGEADVERRYGVGLEQCGKYQDWYQDHPNEKAWITPDGEPAVEIAFDVELGGVQVKGFIDLVVEDEETQEIRVRDNKTGAMPGDDFQLGVYAAALEVQYGIDRPLVGDYWMGKTGKPTKDYDLTEWTTERVGEKFHDVNEKILAEEFPPTTDPKNCDRCPVALSCKFVNPQLDK